MNGLSIAGILIRFLFGGIAVALSSVIAKKMGGKLGGIFATFPAVYLAALLTVRLDYTGSELLGRSMTLSRGALIGMVADIFCALAAGYLCFRTGWKTGLLVALVIWLLVSCLIMIAV
jgi:uncharacterized membrane protein (GlpM family)